MAINALTGRDDTLFGTAAGGAAAARLYPQWMRDARQRGIGVEQIFTPATPAFIDIPRAQVPSGNALMPATSQAPVAPAGDLVRPYSGGEGVGAVGGMNDAVNNQPAPGILGDILGGLGLSTGQFGGAAGGMASGPELAGLDAQAAANTEAMQGSGFGDARGLATGGIVTANRLTGPDPAGPDDGYAALNEGEGVLTAKAIKHYGKGIVARLNKLQVPKEALSKR